MQQDNGRWARADAAIGVHRRAAGGGLAARKPAGIVLRGGRGRDVGAGLGAVAFRSLIYGFTWVVTGTGQSSASRVHADHLPFLGVGLFWSSQ